MSVDRLLSQLVNRTVAAGRGLSEADATESRLARSLIVALGEFKAQHPGLTSTIAREAVVSVLRCIDMNGGEIN
jgi:hypothetical protein